MEIRILGPLEVEVGGQPVRLGPQQRVVLAVLLLEAPRVVPRSRLVELLWGESPPESAAATLRSHVLHLRRRLEPERSAGAGAEVLVTAGAGDTAGYALRINPEQTDAVRFEQLLEEGWRALAADDPSAAATHLHAALALWRGPALADVADRSFAIREVARLEGLRNAALQGRIEADLVLGRHAQVVGELEGLVADQPHHEGLRLQLALALYRSCRQEEAARVCKEGLELFQQRGLDAAKLQALQRDILCRAPKLDRAPPKPSRPFQLPPDIVEFTGRRAALTAIRTRLLPSNEDAGSAVAISAIDGKPGVGKSALAIHVAHQLASQFVDGVLYADLRGAEPELLAPIQVLGQFLRAFGVVDEKVPADLDAASALYRSVLAGNRVLVILDNAADAAQVRPLLPGSPGCAVLVTSRVQLADLEGAVPFTLAVLPEDEAVALLARLVGRRRVNADPAAAVLVARHCGLLPLALRIAGARLRARPAWPVAVLAARLTDERRRLGELEVGELAVRASFRLSYESLAPAEARMFRLFGLLDGPDATAGVAAALAECAPAEAETVLERLADAQLLETFTAGRYRFHDLIRLFAREEAGVEEQSEQHAALERGLSWYLAAAEQAGELLEPTGLHRSDPVRDAHGQALPDRQAALAWLETERANLVAAAKQAAGQAPAPVASVAWGLGNSLVRFFYLRKHWPDWQAVCEAAVQAARRVGNRAAEARPHNMLGTICLEQGRFEEAITWLRQSLEIWREVGDRRQEACTLNNLGIAYWKQGRAQKAIACLEQSLEICREVGDRGVEAAALHSLGEVYHEQGRLEEAIACFTQGLEIHRERGDRHGEGIIVHTLGDAYRAQGRFEEAIACYEQSLAISREAGARYEEGLNLWGLGSATEAVQSPHAARTYLTMALDILVSLQAPEAEEVRSLLATISVSVGSLAADGCDRSQRSRSAASAPPRASKPGRRR